MIQHRLPALLVLLLPLLLAACSTQPTLETEDVDLTLTPKQAVSETALQKDKRVLWGGMIISNTLLEGKTRLEVLAYPLDSDHYPQTGDSPYGRFLLLKDGYLEKVDYAPGRLVSTVGLFTGSRSGKLDESTYTYPVVEAEQLHLWPKVEKERNGTSIHFGFGFLFSN